MITFAGQSIECMNTATRDFIQKHEDDQLHTLALSAARNGEVDLQLALRQIEGRQKIKHKVPEFYACVDLLYPVRLSLEQSSSSLTASYKASLLSGKRAIDLTGGFGVDSFFLADSFNELIYVERDEDLCRLATHNFPALGRTNIKVVQGVAEELIDELPEADLYFIDPHRRDQKGRKMVSIADCEPDVSSLTERIFRKTSRLMIKLSPMLDITQAVRELPQTSEIHVIAVDNECKELLFILEREASKPAVIKTLNFKNDGTCQHYSVPFTALHSAAPSYSSEVETFLYEPNSAVMKSGAYNQLGVDFDLMKFHPNTHLYTSAQLKTDFPGRIFRTIEVFANSRKEMSTMAKRYPKANVALRNYPLTVDLYRRKTGISDGGDIYIFAFQLYSGNWTHVVCRKADVSTSAT